MDLVKVNEFSINANRLLPTNALTLQPKVLHMDIRFDPTLSGEKGQALQSNLQLMTSGLLLLSTSSTSWPLALTSPILNSWRLVDTLSVFLPETLDLYMKVLVLRHRGKNGRFSPLDYRKQVHLDLLLSTPPKLFEHITAIFQSMIPTATGFYTIHFSDVSDQHRDWHLIDGRVKTLRFNIRSVINSKSLRVFSHMEDSQVEELRNPAPTSKPILVKELGTEMPEGVPEYGIGDNMASDDTRASETEEMIKIQNIFDAKFMDIDLEMAKRLHFTPEDLRQYKALLQSKWKAFGTEDSLSCLSDLTPFDAVLKPGAKLPYVRRTIPLNQEKLTFLENHLGIMEKKGLITRVKNPKFGCAIFLVPKKGPKKWRMVADMVPLNKVCERTPLQMPLLEQMLGFFGKSRIYSTWDLLSGFNLLRTNSDLFVIITPFGAFRMNSAPMGWLNTPAIFQDRVVTEILIPSGLYLKYDNGVALWIDDTFLYSDKPQNFLSTTEKFLDALVAKKVRLNIRKCEFLLEKAKWCGRVISEGRWSFDEQYFNSILKTPKPRYKDELLQAFYVANWLSPSMSELAHVRSTFKEMLNLGGKKVAAIKRQNQIIEWTGELNAAWKSFLQAIFNASKRNLANYNPKEGLALFVDASDKFCSLVVAQIQDPEEGEFVEPMHLCPKPMMFLTGEFVGSQVNWHISQKELFPIIHAFNRLDFMLLTHGRPIHVFTDHKNLVFILRPEWEPHKSHAQRLFRWSTLIQSAWMWIHHIPGEKNFLADLLSRWGNPKEEFDESLPALQLGPMRDTKEKPRKFQTLKVLSLRVAKENAKRKIKQMYENEESTDTERETEDEEYTEVEPVSLNMKSTLERFDKNRISFLNPYSPVKFKRITERVIRRWQGKSMRQKPKSLVLNSETKLLYLRNTNRIWIPEIGWEHMIVHNHIANNHDSLHNELTLLKRYYFGKDNIVDAVKTMRRKCIHCQRSPHILKRPYQLTKLPRNCRSILTSDYLYIKDKSYLLVLVDVFSRKTCLQHCDSASASNVVKMLLNFRGSYGLDENFLLITDGGSHFSNEIMTELQEKMRFTQHFSVAYCPWQNGAAEVTNKKILKLVRQLCSEYSLQLDDWKLLIPTIEHVLNNSSNKNNGGLTPNEIFMGYRYNQELIYKDIDFAYIENRFQAPRDNVNVQKYCDDLKKHIEDLNEKNYEYIDLTRSRLRQHHNKSRAYTLQFSPGEWVLVSYHNTAHDKDKTRLKWVGPQLVTEVHSPDVYTVQNLLGKESKIHASRMWFYEGPDYCPDESMKHVFTRDYMELILNKILDHRLVGGKSELLIDWLGLEASDQSWEPALSIAETHSETIIEYFKKINESLPEDLQHLQTKIRAIHLAESRDLDRCVVTSTPRKARSWTSIEVEVLRQTILKYGFGCWHKLTANVHTRSSQQIYNRLQWMLFKVDFKVLEGIRLDVFVIRDLLAKRRSQGNYDNLTRDIALSYATSLSEDAIIIPFLPRISTQTYDVDDKLSTVLKGIQAFLVKAVDGDVITNLREQVHYHRQNLFDCSLTFRENLVIQLENSVVCEGDITVNLTHDDTTSLFEDNKRFFGKRCCVDEHWFIHFKLGWLPASCIKRFRDLLKVRLSFVTNNLYRVSTIGGHCYDFLVAPKHSVPVEMWLSPQTWKAFYEKHGGFDVLHVDPPWKVGAGNPMFGFSMSYRTMNFQEIMTLRLEDGLNQGGLLFLWVVNAHIHNFMQVMESRNLTFLKPITWIKMSKSGKIQPVMGHYFSHATETCFVMVKGEFMTPSSLELFQALPDYITEEKTVNSAKPQTLLRLLRDTGRKKGYTNLRLADIFGRFNNLEDGWLTVGLDAKQQCVHRVSKAM